VERQAYLNAILVVAANKFEWTASRPDDVLLRSKVKVHPKLGHAGTGGRVEI